MVSTTINMPKIFAYFSCYSGKNVAGFLLNTYFIQIENCVDSLLHVYRRLTVKRVLCHYCT